MRRGDSVASTKSWGKFQLFCFNAVNQVAATELEVVKEIIGGDKTVWLAVYDIMNKNTPLYKIKGCDVEWHQNKDHCIAAFQRKLKSLGAKNCVAWRKWSEGNLK